MAYFGSVTITNKFGWSKTVEIHKALFLIGKNKTNDIELSEEQGVGVAPLHLQLICPRSSESVYRLINLADNLLEIVDGPSAGTLLKPRTAQEIRSGDVLVLGEFTLTFVLLTQREICLEKRSPNLGMKLELPHSDLQNGKKLAGLLTLLNHGNNRRCQFTIEVDGLPSDCFQINPAPLLYPGASGEVGFYFVHRGVRPAAGRHTVMISATASQAYPLETICIPLEINVEPVYCFSLELDQPAEAAESIPVSYPSQAVPVSHPNIEDTSSAEPDSPPARADAQPLSESAGIEEGNAQRLPELPVEFAPPQEENGETISVPQPQPAEPNPVPLHERTPEPVISPEEEQKLWAGKTAARNPQRQLDALSGSRRNLRNMLAGKEIHVIKAGEQEIDENSTNSGSQQNAS